MRRRCCARSSPARRRPTVYVFIGLLTFTTYALAGTMREQVCTYMCPWPRIQAAMTDQDALQRHLSRRSRRAARRRTRKAKAGKAAAIASIATQCVAVCPLGIDIRDGDQLECINCALCIDACDDIMTKVGRPTGLIAYDTHVNVERRKRRRSRASQLVRPRTISTPC